MYERLMILAKAHYPQCGRIYIKQGKRPGGDILDAYQIIMIVFTAMTFCLALVKAIIELIKLSQKKE
jgi:hypothetical protein